MPHLPGVASGVTIGVGYDLRFQEADDFEADWSGILTPAQMAALRPHLGKPGSPAACAALGDLHIPFSAAWQVFVTCALPRSEEHTSELQSLTRNSYAVFCLKKQNTSTA